MNALIKMTLTQFKLFLRQPIALFFTIVFPVLLLVIFGLVFGNEPGFGGSEQYGYIDLQVPALAGIVIGTVAFMSIPVATATAREQKILRRYKATPMNPVIYIVADVIMYLVITILGMFALILVARLAFGLRFAGNWFLVFLGFILSAITFITIGYVLASVAPNARTAQVLGQAIFFPMMFLSGAAIPLVIMPEAIQNISQFLPLTQAVQLLQDLWFGAGWNGTAVIVLVALLIICFGISATTFRWE